MQTQDQYIINIFGEDSTGDSAAAAVATVRNHGATLAGRYGGMLAEQTVMTNITSIWRLAQQLQADDIVPAVLVNNAGFGLYGAHAKQDPEQVRALLELNIVALTLLTRQLLPPMLQAGRGRILNIASTAAFLPGPRMATYFASKAYVLSYSEALAEELAGRGISVTAVCPGPTRSEFFERAGMSPAVLAMGRMPSSREVAEFGVRAMQRGQRVAIHGASNHLLAFLPRLAPRRAVAWVVGWITRPRGRRAG